MIPYLAHVKWFVDSHEVKSQRLDNSYLLIALAIVVFGLLAAVIVQRFFARYDKSISKTLGKYSMYVPDIVRLATGLSLAIFSLNHYVLAQNSGVDASGWVLLQLIVGLGWILGVAVRPLAVSAILLYVPVIVSQPIAVFEHLEVLAAAVYLFAYGGGRVTLQALIGKTDKSIAAIANSFSNIYRILIGVSLFTLAFSEKLFAAPLAQEFLEHHHWNFLSGIGVSDLLFITIIGSLELLFGLLIILNIVPRLVVLAILGAMAATAIVLGINEVYGHLFAVGLVAFVWLNPDTKTPTARK